MAIPGVAAQTWSESRAFTVIVSRFTALPEMRYERDGAPILPLQANSLGIGPLPGTPTRPHVSSNNSHTWHGPAGRQRFAHGCEPLTREGTGENRRSDRL